MKFVTPQEAQALLAKGAVELIDVRNPNEFAQGHVPGAKLIPLDQLRVEPKLHLTRDHLLFVCAKGGRSQKAAELAEQLGFTDVPLICTRELEVEGSMPRVVRMMAHVETDLPRADITHVYLHGAAALRRDLARVRTLPDAGPADE